MTRRFNPRSLDVRLTLAIIAAMGALVLVVALREAIRWSKSRQASRRQPYRPSAE